MNAFTNLDTINLMRIANDVEFRMLMARHRKDFSLLSAYEVLHQRMHDELAARFMTTQELV